MAEIGAELLFHVITDRTERAALIVTTNLPFSEWTQVVPNARLCKALLDRVTDRAHIIETGTESYRFRRTIATRKWGSIEDAMDEIRCQRGPLDVPLTRGHPGGLCP
jgi:hypothetical protein